MWWMLAAWLATAQEVRGVTVSCPTWGWEWGSDQMVETLDELDDLGVTWVQIHPYASIARNGSVSYRELNPAAPPQWIARPVAEAHARGQKVFIKPHLAYWGSGFGWRGEIEFDDEAAWTRFFAGYRAWITAMAEVSQAVGADGFAVGTELDRTVAREASWRAVIADVRRAYRGPITYAANWDRYRDVPFWDAVDVVGIQAYFPLVDHPSPDRKALDEGWSRVMREMADFRRSTGRHIVFTELGYNRSTTSAQRPWEARDDPDQGAVQEQCLDAALSAIQSEPSVIGAFLWKWFPGDRVPRDFAVQRPGPREVVRRKWAEKE